MDATAKYGYRVDIGIKGKSGKSYRTTVEVASKRKDQALQDAIKLLTDEGFEFDGKDFTTWIELYKISNSPFG